MGEDMMLLSVKEIVRQYQLLLPEIIKGGFTINFDLPPALLSMDDLKKNKICSCNIKNLLGIIADGKISICGIGKTIDKLVLGKVGRDSIKDVWENNPILKLIREDIPEKMKGVCGKCLFKSSCLGKCRAEVFYDAEDLLAPFSVCQEAYEQGFFPESRLMP
jgi:radical SAM protein with 4Fe4S-binding SPASM domain